MTQIQDSPAIDCTKLLPSLFSCIEKCVWYLSWLLVLAAAACVLIFVFANFDSIGEHKDNGEIKVTGVLKDKVEVIKSTLAIVAGLAGGVWALHRFILSRPDAWTLDLFADIEITGIDDGKSLVVVKTKIHNTSPVRVKVKTLKGTVRVLDIGTNGFVDSTNVSRIDATGNGEETTFANGAQTGTTFSPPDRKTTFTFVNGTGVNGTGLELDLTGGDTYWVESSATYCDSFALIVPTGRMIEVRMKAVSRHDPYYIDYRLLKYVPPPSKQKNLTIAAAEVKIIRNCP